MFDCRIAARRRGAPPLALSRLAGSLPPSAPHEISFLLPTRGRIGLAANRRTAFAIIEGIDSTRLAHLTPDASQA